MFIIVLIANAWIHVVQMQDKERERKERSGQHNVILLPPPAPKPRERYVIEVPPDKEVRIPITLGMICTTEPVEANQVVWVRWEGSEEIIKDWKGRPSGGAMRRPGANYKYLRSAETFPIKVEVEIAPD